MHGMVEQQVQRPQQGAKGVAAEEPAHLEQASAEPTRLHAEIEHASAEHARLRAELEEGDAAAQRTVVWPPCWPQTSAPSCSGTPPC